MKTLRDVKIGDTVKVVYLLFRPYKESQKLEMKLKKIA